MPLVKAAVGFSFSGTETLTYAGDPISFAPKVDRTLNFTVGDAADNAEKIGYLSGTANSTGSTIDLCTADTSSGNGAGFNGLRMVMIANTSATIPLALYKPAANSWTGASGSLFNPLDGKLSAGDTIIIINPGDYFQQTSGISPWLIASGTNSGVGLKATTSGQTATWEMWLLGNIP